MVKVVLVRHADIDLPRTSQDPSLNDAGRARARALAHVLGSAEIAAIFTSKFTRTKETVEPLATARGIQPREASAAMIGELLSGPDATVLIAGHSDSVPAMIGALGITPPLPIIDEPNFDNLFVVTATSAAGNAVLVHLKYG